MEISFKENILDARGMDSVKMPEFDIKGSCDSYWLVQIANKLIEMEKEAIWVYELVQACPAPWMIHLALHEELREEYKRLARAVSDLYINIRMARG